jgi:hypothetical protein
MKFSMIVASMVCLASGVTQAAPAHPFTPADTNFTSAGKITLTTAQGTATCQQKLSGSTGKNGMAHVTNAVYSGKDAACATMSATGLPWKVMPTGANTGKIIAMGLMSGGVACGPSLVHVSLRPNGVWNYSGAALAACTASAMIHTNPAIAPAP